MELRKDIKTITKFFERAYSRHSPEYHIAEEITKRYVGIMDLVGEMGCEEFPQLCNMIIYTREKNPKKMSEEERKKLGGLLFMIGQESQTFLAKRKPGQDETMEQIFDRLGGMED
jgi:hypothetical protein